MNAESHRTRSESITPRAPAARWAASGWGPHSPPGSRSPLPGRYQPNDGLALTVALLVLAIAQMGIHLIFQFRVGG